MITAKIVELFFSLPCSQVQIQVEVREQRKCSQTSIQDLRIGQADTEKNVASEYSFMNQVKVRENNDNCENSRAVL